jgi:hypothetical protein
MRQRAASVGGATVGLKVRYRLILPIMFVSFATRLQDAEAENLNPP